MVRGTNKVIIEVNDTQNKYFEKAILFVRENISQKNDANINAEAKKYIEDVKIKSRILRGRHYFCKNIGLMAGSAAIGALITMILT